MEEAFEQVKRLLANKEISNYRISQATGIAQSTLSDYAKGKTKVERMPVETAIKLHNYYLEEVEKMNTTYTVEMFEGQNKCFESDYIVKFQGEEAAKTHAENLAKENPNNLIYISFFRKSDGQTGYINRHGADNTGESWTDVE